MVVLRHTLERRRSVCLPFIILEDDDVVSAVVELSLFEGLVVLTCEMA